MLAFSFVSVTTACSVMRELAQSVWRAVWERFREHRRQFTVVDHHELLMDLLVDSRVVPDLVQATYPYGETL